MMSGRLAAVGVVAITLAACTSAPSVPDGSAGQRPGSEGDPLQPQTIIWLAARAVEENDVPIQYDLALARGDGSIIWSESVDVAGEANVGRLSFVDGPRGGLMTYGLFDGDETSVHAVTASDGVDHELAHMDASVLAAIAHPGGESVYLVADDVEGARLVHLTLDGERSDVIELPDLSADQSNGLGLLSVTPDGSTLLIQHCDDDARCWWLIHDIQSGDIRELRPADTGPVVDVSNDALLAMVPGCAVVECPYVLVDLLSGETSAMDLHATQARLAIAANGETVLLHDNQGLGVAPLRITGVDLQTGAERVLYQAEPNSEGFGLARQGQCPWAPRGWFCVAPPGLNVGESGIGPVLVRIADGMVVELTAIEGS